jgi:hypothetical protein
MLALLTKNMVERGLPAPILVGGAAVEFYSASAIMTGDVDLVSPVQEELEDELLALGFIRPIGKGHTPSGWVHPELGLGFEVVGVAPLEGAVDRKRIALVDVPNGAAFMILPVEDMIADRMGQYASGTAPEMLRQATALLDLHPNLDDAYLDQRIRSETMGDYGLEDLRKAAH